MIVRHALIKTFTFIAQNSAGFLIQKVIPYLNDENWHIREEVINIIVICMLISPTTCNIQILESLTQRLEDDKQKI
jgi:hypothetical protein